MPINGIERIIYGVEDLDLSTKFFDDFGLVQSSADATLTQYTLEEGSHVILRRIDDPILPQTSSRGAGAKEVILGVDNLESLDKLADGLARDRSVIHDGHGAVHFHDDAGLAWGLKVFARKKVVFAPDPVNAPGHITRLNTQRKWRTRARPKTITHVVYVVQDVKAQFAFFRDRLNFRMSDEQGSFGIYLRGDGTNEHHNIFFLNGKLPFMPGGQFYHHTNFGVEDIDELMVGENYMKLRGWKPGQLGTGRHRIASALFCYLQCPAGGEAEYGADSDYLDDNWIPRQWNEGFGSYIWLHDFPDFLPKDQKWEWRYHPDYLPRGPSGT